jgi:hypothetical protein
MKLLKGNGMPIRRVKVLPNSSCPCGSGLKAKHCCGTETKYYASKQPEKPKPNAGAAEPTNTEN